MAGQFSLAVHSDTGISTCVALGLSIIGNAGGAGDGSSIKDAPHCDSFSPLGLKVREKLLAGL